MKTEVILKRSFMTGSVGQNSKTKMFCANDLINIANIKRRELDKPIFNLSQYLKAKNVTEFIEELQLQFPDERIIKKGRGRNSQTWVHPLLFIDISLALDPKLKVSVYGWLQDELIRYRNDSGSSYNRMIGELYSLTPDKHRFTSEIKKLAIYIRKKCNVEDWNTATESQLKLRDKIHNNITLLCSVLRNANQAIRIGVENALNENIK